MDLNEDDFPIGRRPSGLLSPLALRKAPPEPAPLPPGVDVTIEANNDNSVTINPKTGVMTIEEDDGTVTVDLDPQRSQATSRPSKFNDNLAEIIDEGELGRISQELISGIQQDDQSRAEWLETRAQGLRILGLKVENPRTAIDNTAALEGMSNVRHPLLLEALLTFQANASGELLPAGGPVKIDDKMTETGQSNDLAETLEGDLNYYLTTVATEYYPDTDRMLLTLGFGGSTFKKVYYCPLRERPVSESVDAVNLIVSNAATDMRNSGRVTQVIAMRPSTLRRMQIAGAYREVPITTPTGLVANAVELEIQGIQGVRAIAQLTEDRDHTIWECYCELDIKGFEDKRNGKKTGLPLPYRVVIDRDSQQVLEVRRNWKESDASKLPRICFVKYSYVPGFGFYDIGLLNILGNTTNALTAGWRELLDAGMFANFPGFLYRKIIGRQNTNEFRVPPGGGVPIETDGAPIGEAVMALPYKDISPAFAGFLEKMAETGQRVGGTANLKIAEGRQDAPVGTTLAQLEQAKMVEGAVHRRNWRSQSEELQLLKECFREHPDSFMRAIQARGATDWSPEKFLAALNEASLVPQADPETPSHMHRLMKAMGLIQLDKAYPGVMDPIEIVKRVVNQLGFGDFEQLRNKQPPQAGMPPELMLEMQKLADKSQDREFKKMFEELKQANALVQARWQQAADERKFQHEQTLQQAESQGEQLQHRTDLEQSEMELRGTVIESAADVEAARIAHQTADTAGKHSVAVAKHGVDAEKHKAAGLAGGGATKDEIDLEKARKETADVEGKHKVAHEKAKADTFRAKPKPTKK